MSGQLEISGTPGEIYEQHIVPAIFSRWAPELVEAAGVQPGKGCLTSPVVLVRSRVALRTVSGGPGASWVSTSMLACWRRHEPLLRIP
jgi:hypothetical protein